jgi:hypothetical protein
MKFSTKTPLIKLSIIPPMVFLSACQFSSNSAKYAYYTITPNTEVKMQCLDKQKMWALVFTRAEQLGWDNDTTNRYFKSRYDSGKLTTTITSAYTNNQNINPTASRPVYGATFADINPSLFPAGCDFGVRNSPWVTENKSWDSLYHRWIGHQTRMVYRLYRFSFFIDGKPQRIFTESEKNCFLNHTSNDYWDRTLACDVSTNVNANNHEISDELLSLKVFIRQEKRNEPLCDAYQCDYEPPVYGPQLPVNGCQPEWSCGGEPAVVTVPIATFKAESS